MATIFNILYIFIFFIMIVISTMILLASNLDKCFKQGKIVEIRCTYIILSIIISFITTKAIIELIENTYQLFIK